MVWRNTLCQVMMQQPVITLGVESFACEIIFKLASIRAVCQYKLKVIESMEAPQ